MVESTKKILKNWLDFKGETELEEYWLGFLGTFLINLIVSTIAGAIIFLIVLCATPIMFAGVNNADSSGLGFVSILLIGIMILIGAVASVFMMYTEVAQLAAQTRRLRNAKFPPLLVLLNFIGFGMVPLIMCIFYDKDNLSAPEKNEVTENVENVIIENVNNNSNVMNDKESEIIDVNPEDVRDVDFKNNNEYNNSETMVEE